LPAPRGDRVYVTHVAGNPVEAFDLLPAAAGVARARPHPLPRPSTRLGRVPPAMRSALDQFTGENSPGSIALARAAALDADDGLLHVAVALNQTGEFVPIEDRTSGYGGHQLVGPIGDKTVVAVATLDVARDRWLPLGFVHAGRARVENPTALVLDPRDHALFLAGAGAALAAVLPAPARETASRFDARALDATRTVAIPPGTTGLALAADGTLAAYSPLARAVLLRTPDGTAHTLELYPERLAPELALGRALFYRATDPRISSGGLSCAGCHPDGRDDGLVWFLDRGPRQTPTLAGRLAPPFNWTGTSPTLEANITQTVHRLGGRGLPPAETAALAAYLQRALSLPSPPTASASGGAPALAVRRGEALFASAGCAGCHDPARNFVDGRIHALAPNAGTGDRDTRYDTPSLRAVAATAPYFHDGRYATLLDVLRDPTAHMSETHALPPDDQLALLAYLQTL
jgi:hypothetical protein